MKNRLLKRVMTIGTILMVMVALVVGSALPGLAAANDNQQVQPSSVTKILKGKAVSIAADKTSFVIQDGSQVQTTIKVDKNTKYYKIQLPPRLAVAAAKPVLPPTAAKPAPANEALKQKVEKFQDKLQDKLQKRAEAKPGNGPKNNTVGEVEELLPEITEDMLEGVEGQVQGQSAMSAFRAMPAWFNWLRLQARKATFDNIAVGDRIITKVNAADNLAKVVLIIKPPKIRTVKGTITAVAEGSITITPANGTAVQLKWDEKTRFVLHGFIQVQTGQYGIATYNIDTMRTSVVQVYKTAPVPVPVPSNTTTAAPTT